MIQLDSLVVGGGIAGATAALAIARSGRTVGLIEAIGKPCWKIGETLRPEARPLLQSLGVWAEFVECDHLPCYANASAWGEDRLVERDFIFNPYGNAWQLDRVVFEEMLIVAAEKAGTFILRGKPVEHFDRVEDRWRIELAGVPICASWLIDATGRRAMVAKRMQVKREILDQLVAVYCTSISTTGTDRDSRTLIESCPDGWWYTALTRIGRRTISFQTDAELLLKREWRTSEWFTRQLAQTRHLSALFECHGYRLTEPPRLTSAHSGKLEQYSGDRWLAIGDAAISFDPLSGQGILKAIQSGMRAAQLVGNGTAEGRATFDQWNERLWKQFSINRAGYYNVERRWQESAFWKRRLSV